MTQLPLTSCPVCGGNLIVSNGSLVCSSCGLVISDELPAEWIFDEALPFIAKKRDEENSRSQKTSTSSENREMVMKIKKMEKLTKDRRNKLVQEVWRLGKVLNLPNYVIDTATQLAQNLSRCSTRISSLPVVATALLYIAANMNGMMISLTELAKKTGISRSEIGSAVMKLKKVLDIKLVRDSKVFMIKSLEKVCNILNLPNDVFMEAVKILDSLDLELLTAGRNPLGLVGAIVYMVANSKDKNKMVSMKKVAEALGITEPTIRTRVKMLRGLLENNGLLRSESRV